MPFTDLTVNNPAFTNNCYCPLLSLQSPLHPIPASPTSPQSILDGSNSTLSGSASSGVSSLSESNFGGPPSSDPPTSRTDTLESVPSSQAWTTDQEDLDSPYQPVRYSTSEPEVLDVVKPPPCRSLSAPGGVTTTQTGGQILPQAPGMASTGAPSQDGLPHAQQLHYYHHHFHPHYIAHHPPLYHLHEPPPALPPKPYLREGCIPEEDPLNPQSAAPPAPRPMPRKISQPLIAATKDEQAKVAWEHGLGEEWGVERAAETWSENKLSSEEKREWWMIRFCPAPLTKSKNDLFSRIPHSAQCQTEECSRVWTYGKPDGSQFVFCPWSFPYR